MRAELVSIDGLDRQVAELSKARTPSDIFKLLLEGARMAVPRAAVFLIRQGEIKGWGSLGYDAESAQRQRGFVAPAGSGWLGEVAGGSETELHPRDASIDPDFGQAPASESVAVALHVKNRSIAIITGERSGSEAPWFPATLSLLVRVAELRLELDLARRKIQQAATARASAPAVATPSNATPTRQSGATAAAAATPAAVAPGPAPGPAPGSAGAEDQKLDAARRYARLVATDIRLYNEDAVAHGRRDGDLLERLADHVGRGKETFLRRHGDLGPVGLELLHSAYVEVLAGGAGNLIPRSALD